MTSRISKSGEAGWIRTERDSDQLLLTAGGRWQNATLADIDDTLRNLAPGSLKKARIDLTAIEAMDSTGAWVLYRTRKQLRAAGLTGFEE